MHPSYPKPLLLHPSKFRPNPSLKSCLRTLPLGQATTRSPCTDVRVVVLALLLLVTRAPRPRARRLDEQPVALAHEDRRLATDVDLARLRRRVLVVPIGQVAVLAAGLLHPGVAAHRAGLTALEAVRLARAALQSEQGVAHREDRGCKR